ncbi:MAG: glycosyltransferase [Actinomycetota bacterium]
MPRLLLITPAELTRDPRARRQASAAQRLGFGVVGLSGRISGEEPAPLEGVTVVRVGRSGHPNAQWMSGASARRETVLRRELRGLYRLARLGARTVQLVRGGRTLGSVAVVHANDLDTLPAGWLLARESSARLVYDAHELYVEFEPDPPRLYAAVLSAIECFLTGRADAVVTVSRPLAAELEQRLSLPRRPLVVLNAPDLDPVEPEAAAEGALRAIYQGGFGSGRPLSDLLEAVRLAPSVQLTLRAARAHPEVLRRSVDSAGLADRIEVAEPVPPDEAVHALQGHHVGLIFDRPVTRNAELSLPNKLFEYLMAGLAVVAPRLPGLALVEREGLGVTFEAGRPDELAHRLEELAADRPHLAELRRNARAAALERYNAGAQALSLATAWGLRRDGGA